MDGIRQGPIVHESLPDHILAKLRDVYDIVGHYSCPTLEQWELDFMRETDPVVELKIWQRIARAWIRYCRKCTPQDSAIESCALVAMTMSQLAVTQAAEQIGAERTDMLIRCYLDAI